MCVRAGGWGWLQRWAGLQRGLVQGNEESLRAVLNEHDGGIARVMFSDVSSTKAQSINLLKPCSSSLRSEAKGSRTIMARSERFLPPLSAAPLPNKSQDKGDLGEEGAAGPHYRFTSDNSQAIPRLGM